MGASGPSGAEFRRKVGRASGSPWYHPHKKHPSEPTEHRPTMSGPPIHHGHFPHPSAPACVAPRHRFGFFGFSSGHDLDGFHRYGGTGSALVRTAVVDALLRNLAHDIVTG